jgi:hypothetical protein
VVVLSNDNTREWVASLMINTPITINEFDNYLSTASFVERLLPGVKNNRTPSMFKIIGTVYYDSKDWGYHDKQNKRLKATPKQLSIYELVIFTLLKLEHDTREMLSLRNFPERLSIKELNRMYLDLTYNQLKYRYRLALFDACNLVNRLGYQSLVSKGN